MIKALTILVILLLITQGCVSETADVKTHANNFTSSLDTIIIKTEKRRGAGLFALGVSAGYFRDLTDTFPHPIIVPDDIKEVKRMDLLTDFMATNKYYIDIIQGKIKEDSVFVIDENNNNNLTDDSVRIFRPIVWNSEDKLIKCKYNIQKYQTIHKDSSWLRIGFLRNELWLGASEHYVGDFSIDNEAYQIGIVSSFDFTYPTILDTIYPPDSPSLALFSQNSIMKDTLNERDILERGEILKLNNLYYKFESVSQFGDSLVLVKENNFHELVGTQVGMIAPEFTGVTISGDTIDSRSLHDRPLVIANSCGCGGDRQSTEAFFEITEALGDQVNIVRLDDRIDPSLKGLHLEMDNESNKDLYNTYRKAYCSRSCYTIDKNSRIIDKFQVTEWEQYLPKLIGFKG